LASHHDSDRFERAMLPHLRAAYNLARWLTGNDHDAEDVVQEAYLRAFRFFERCHGDGRAWLLAVVRNTCYTWLRRQRVPEAQFTPFDEEIHGGTDPMAEPLTLLLRQAEREQLREAVERLPVGYREVIVLRELEGCSYKDVAAIAEIPLGTVMSRLARARKALHESLVRQHREESCREL
jgi:RNA polymerase sigma-70 factor (ECF subfamily)